MKNLKKVIVILLIFSIMLILSNPIIAANKSVKPKQIKLNMKKKTLYVGQTASLKVTNVKPINASDTVKWKSSNKKIVTVTSSGKIKAISNGTAKVTAISKKDFTVKASCIITVKKFKPKNISFKKAIIKEGYNILEKQSYLEEPEFNKVITSYNELQNFIKEAYMKYPDKSFQKSELYKKLKSYNKTFFKKKTLLLVVDITVSSSQSIRVDKLRLKQKTNGKVVGKLYVNHEKRKPDVGWTDDMCYNHIFLKINKNDADLIQSYKLIVK